MHPKVQEYLDRVVIRNGKKWIDIGVNLYDLGLTELNFHDININGFFWCSYNNLTTLKGAPKTVNGSFVCFNNKLITLKGSPEIVNGNFRCCDNQLTTLEGSPTNINGDLSCYNNPLKSLKGLNDVKGYIHTNTNTNCDHFIQYTLMNKIRLT